jgi:hypothetical protein
MLWSFNCYVAESTKPEYEILLEKFHLMYQFGSRPIGCGAAQRFIGV